VNRKITRIISIEDNVDHFDIIRFHLEDLVPDLEVLHFADGESALNSFGQIREFLPQLMLLDMNLPKFSGIEILRRLRSDPKLRRLPVIMFTTSNNARDIRSAYESGANSYLLKPMEPDGMRNSLKAILDYWGSNELACLEEVDRTP